MSFGLGRAPVELTNNTSNNNNADGIDSSTPWMAASDGNLSLLQASLAQLNLPVTAADENGYTLLQAAASYSQLAVMNWLFSQQQQLGLLLSAVDHEGDSALHYASTVDAAKRLIEAGIEIHRRNQEGKTPLDRKKEELADLMEEQDDDDDEDDEAKHLRAVIEYLSTFPGTDGIPQ